MTTAHPHHDPERNELVNYIARFSRVSEYVLYGLPAERAQRRVIARLPVERPAYMHSFGMSARHLILGEYPLRVNPLKLAFSGKPFIQNYVWEARAGRALPGHRPRDRRVARQLRDRRLLLLPPRQRLRARRARLVVDLIAYEDASIIDILYLDGGGTRGGLPATELRRYEIDLGGGGVSWAKLAEGSLELPRIDYGRRNTRDYTYAYCAGASDADWIDQLVKVDVSERRAHGLVGARVLPGRADLRARARRGGRGRGRGAVGGARRGRRALLPARARRGQLRGAGPGRGAAPHPFGFHGHVHPRSDDEPRTRIATGPRSGCAARPARGG